MSTLQEAVQDLISLAMQATKESECNLLLDSAKRLNPELDRSEYKIQWLATWIETNKNRKGAVYNE